MKVAVLGAWHVHAKGYTAEAKRRGEVTGIWEENPAWRHSFAEENGIPEYDSFEALLASDAEGVIVTGATNRHADDIVRIAAAGKHIFTEKVLALTEADCRRVEKAVLENGVRFVISFPQKCTPGPQTVKHLADTGVLGEVQYFRFRNCHNGSTGHWLPAHFYNKEQCGGGAMIDLGAHGMYLADWFLGKPDGYRSVFTHACRDEKDAVLNPDCLEDNAVTVMRYPSGAIAVNETGFVSVGCPMTLEVGGTSGFAVFKAGCDSVSLSVAGEHRDIPFLPAKPSPLASFLSGEIPEGCGIADALALTVMMTEAYRNIL